MKEFKKLYQMTREEQRAFLIPRLLVLCAASGSLGVSLGVIIGVFLGGAFHW